MEMNARKIGCSPENAQLYKTMVTRNMLPSILLARSGSLCNSAQFSNRSAPCVRDGETLSLLHVIRRCSHTADWRTKASQLLECEPAQLEEHICSNSLDIQFLQRKLLQLEAVCVPLLSIHTQAQKCISDWVVPAIPRPSIPVKIAKPKYKGK